MAKRGAKGKFSPEIQSQILEMMSNGAFLCDAADAVGISQSTINAWIKEKPHFSEAIKKARAGARAEAVKTILEAGKTQWQARAWFLERSDYKKWGRHESFKHTSPDKSMGNQVVIVKLPEEDAKS